MKNIIFLAIWLVLTLAFAGCDGTETMTKEADLPPPTVMPAEGESATVIEEDEAASEICPELSPHPVAADIAETFEVEYEEVVGWFCSGHSFEEILLALQTQKIADVEVKALLNERLNGNSWEQIWNNLGITEP